jgi:NAD(P)-dependent dehydrogenase (short-subunit alcohol dehydrogenase family)
MTAELLEQRPDLDEEWLKGSMLERLSTPDEYRGPVIFLLSKASSFMTGADLIIDGGHTAY